jgi:hypothetical protein
MAVLGIREHGDVQPYAQTLFLRSIVPSNRPRARRSANRRPAAPPGRTRSPGPTGGRRPGPAAPAPPTGFRGGLEQASLPLLTALSRLPRWLIGLLPGVLLLGGLLAPAPWGAALLGLVTVFLGWLLALSWPRLDGRSRTLRTAVVLLVAALAVAHIAGVI